MRKYIIIISFFVLITNIHAETYSLKRNFDTGQWEIFREDNGQKELWYSLSDEMKDESVLYELKERTLIFVGKDNTIMKVDLPNKQLIYTGIQFNSSFAISSDATYLCTFTQISGIENQSDIEDVFGISTMKQQLFPAIYNLDTGKLVEKYYIAEVMNFKGDETICFNPTNNSFFFQYMNDYPFDSFSGEICLTDFSIHAILNK